MLLRILPDVAPHHVKPLGSGSTLQASSHGVVFLLSQIWFHLKTCKKPDLFYLFFGEVCHHPPPIYPCSLNGNCVSGAIPVHWFCINQLAGEAASHKHSLQLCGQSERREGGHPVAKTTTSETHQMGVI